MNQEKYIRYCPRCGKIKPFTDIWDETICDFCGHDLVDSDFVCKTYDATEEKLRDNAINELIKNSPEFDEELYQKRENSKYLFGGSKTSATSSVQCPYCKSTNVSRISTASKVFSVGLLGLASNKVGKQWHCNSCNSNF